MSICTHWVVDPRISWASVEPKAMCRLVPTTPTQRPLALLTCQAGHQRVQTWRVMHSFVSQSDFRHLNQMHTSTNADLEWIAFSEADWDACRKCQKKRQVRARTSGPPAASGRMRRTALRLPQTVREVRPAKSLRQMVRSGVNLGNSLMVKVREFAVASMCHIRPVD